jgi:hypothetical protein
MELRSGKSLLESSSSGTSELLRHVTVRPPKEEPIEESNEESKREEEPREERKERRRSPQRTSMAYIDMRPLPPYSGKKTEDLDLWIEKINNFQLSRGWSNEETFAHVVTILEGRALEAAHKIKDASLDGLIAVLQKNFGVVDIASEERKLATIKMWTEETVDDFVYRLRQLQRRSNATQKQAINAFKYGLREDLALWIISENPSSLDEAIESAKLLEQASITLKAKESDSLASQILSLRKEVSDLRKKNEDLEADRPKVNALDQQSNDNRRFQSKPVLSCYYCGKRGHVIKDCYSNPANKQNQNRNRNTNQQSTGRGRSGTAQRGRGGYSGRGRNTNQKN